MLKKTVIAFLTIALLSGSSPALPQGMVNAREYPFKEDAPSAWAKESVAGFISEGKAPEKLQKDFKRPITVGEYAELYYNATYDASDEKLIARIKVVDGSISDASADYVKKAFITGLINSAGELGKTMTREEAASRLVAVNTNLSNASSYINFADYNSISPERLDDVAAIMEKGLISAIENKFSPKSPFTVEQAIAGMGRLQADYILGLIPFSEVRDAASIIVKKDGVYLSFGEKADAEDYIYTFVSPRLDDLEITGERQRFDVGYMIIELNGADFDVGYTMKDNVCNVKNFDRCDEQPTYGTENYKSEPRELKADENADLTIQPDKIHKELYTEVDAILKKVIKPSMTLNEKIKAIHDYVVKNVTYSGNGAVTSGESALQVIKTKKGVCGNYASLFYYLSRRALIPVRILEGDAITGGKHAWNLVYIDNQWLHCDTTWDDSEKKTSYDYYLKPMEYMMKTHKWSGTGYPEPEKYPKMDGMKLKTSMEFRIFLLQQLSNGLKDTITFKLADKNIDKDYRFLAFYIPFGAYTMKYDAKADKYTLKYRPE